jgi:hypothetical protein
MLAKGGVVRLSTTTIGRLLLVLCAVAAAVAAAAAVPTVLDAGSATRFVETWRCFGFATFAVLFLVLAWQPRGSRGLWVAVLGNKLALTLTGLAWSGEADGASDAVVWDGTLTVVLVVALVLTRGWRRPASAPAGGVVGSDAERAVSDPARSR